MRVQYGLMLLCLVILISGCTAVDSDGNDGQIIMMPVTNEELGFNGVVPMNWHQDNPGVFTAKGSLRDFGILVHNILPGTGLEGLIDSLEESRGVVLLSGDAGEYHSPVMDWETYLVEFDEQGLATLRGRMGVAEQDSTVYIVFSGSIENNYERYPQVYDTVFYQVLHAFKPIGNIE